MWMVSAQLREKCDLLSAFYRARAAIVGVAVDWEPGRDDQNKAPWSCVVASCLANISGDCHAL